MWNFSRALLPLLHQTVGLGQQGKTFNQSPTWTDSNPFETSIQAMGSSRYRLGQYISDTKNKH